MSLYPIVACNVPVAPIRAESAHRAEQTTQLLFGERATILEELENGWAFIRTHYDDYEGWVRRGQLSVLDDGAARKLPKHLVGIHGGCVQTHGTVIWIPAGAELSRPTLPLPGHEHAKFKGAKVELKEAGMQGGLLVHYVRTLLHAPYQWGGRTTAGIDCSGLVQLAYKLCGARLPRDASQQAIAGRPVDFLQEAKPGDLAFFDNEEGRITHVGLLADSATIIHATDTAGCVVEDRIDMGGIISLRLKKRTHNLRMIRRYD